MEDAEKEGMVPGADTLMETDKPIRKHKNAIPQITSQSNKPTCYLSRPRQFAHEFAYSC